jgi:hypothetical protein
MTDAIRLTWAPESCKLRTVERPLREAEFAEFFRDHLTLVRRPAATVAELTLDAASPHRARELAALETSCCAFFSFDVREVDSRVLVTVGVPPGRVAVLDALVDAAVAASGAEVAP